MIFIGACPTLCCQLLAPETRSDYTSRSAMSTREIKGNQVADVALPQLRKSVASHTTVILLVIFVTILVGSFLQGHSYLSDFGTHSLFVRISTFPKAFLRLQCFIKGSVTLHRW